VRRAITGAGPSLEDYLATLGRIDTEAVAAAVAACGAGSPPALVRAARSAMDGRMLEAWASARLAADDDVSDAELAAVWARVPEAIRRALRAATDEPAKASLDLVALQIAELGVNTPPGRRLVLAYFRGRLAMAAADGAPRSPPPATAAGRPR